MSYILIGVAVLGGLVLIAWLTLGWALKDSPEKGVKSLEDRKNPRAGSQPARRPKPPR